MSITRTKRKAGDDPFALAARIINKIHSQWLIWTYPFHSVGLKFWAHSSCELSRSVAPYIKIGDRVSMDRDVYLNIPCIPKAEEPVIVLEEGCQIGRRCLISARNRVQLGKNTIFGPSVLVMDHDYAVDELVNSINDQKPKEGGTIRIEEGCWIGFGAAIVCNKDSITIGKNSVIGANAVVTKSVPPFSVVTGNPGRVIKQFDPVTHEWVLGSVSR